MKYIKAEQIYPIKDTKGILESFKIKFEELYDKFQEVYDKADSSYDKIYFITEDSVKYLIDLNSALNSAIDNIEFNSKNKYVK